MHLAVMPTPSLSCDFCILVTYASNNGFAPTVDFSRGEFTVNQGVSCSFFVSVRDYKFYTNVKF